MLVCCLGEVMLDVLVETPLGLAVDDDVPAAIELRVGGQGANVAVWVAALGGGARLVGPRGAGGQGRLLAEALATAGVEPHLVDTDRAGTVVSVVADGRRTLASDPGTTDWLARVRPGPWLAGADWLHVSGYALLRAPDPNRLVQVAEAAVSAGTRVAVDLSSATMIEEYGAARFRRLCQALHPDVVFANDAEWAACDLPDAPAVVRKHGAAGCSFVTPDGTEHRRPAAGPVRDVTGAGDALTAGFLVGGPDLAMRAAARCVAGLGAQPEPAR